MLTNYLAITAICILTLLVLGYMAYDNSILEQHMKRAFLLAITCVAVVILAEGGDHAV